MNTLMKPIKATKHVSMYSIETAKQYVKNSIVLDGVLLKVANIDLDAKPKPQTPIDFTCNQFVVAGSHAPVIYVDVRFTKSYIDENNKRHVWSKNFDLYKRLMQVVTGIFENSNLNFEYVTGWYCDSIRIFLSGRKIDIIAKEIGEEHSKLHNLEINGLLILGSEL